VVNLQINKFSIDTLININNENNSNILNLVFFIKNFEIEELEKGKIKGKELSFDDLNLLNINKNYEIYNLLMKQLFNISRVRIDFIIK
jgi:hypothetical protein